MTLEELMAAIEELAAKMKASQEAIKAAGDANTEEVAAAKSALATYEKKNADLLLQFKALDDKLIAVEIAQKSFRSGVQKSERKTLGQHFVESKMFAEMSATKRGNNTPLEVERKNITSLAASAGALVRPDRDSEVVMKTHRATRIRDLIPAVPTSSGSVEFMRQLVYTNNAAPQGTIAGVGGGELVAKGQSNITWELVTVPVRTMAHWTPASRQVLDDAPMLQGLIDSELSYGLDLLSDAQILSGSGAGQNITGILVDAGVQNAGNLPAGSTGAAQAPAMIDHIRKGIRMLQELEFYNPTGIVMHPTDWEKIEGAKATTGQYLMMQFPTDGAEGRVWRVPVVVTTAIPATTFLIGDWTLGAKMYVREGVSVRISESHADYFVRNGVAILAEERYALAIQRPQAFVKGVFTV